MWNWRMCFGVFILLVGLFSFVVSTYHWWKDTHESRCAAAKTTVLEEAAVLVADGKFPSERISDRWKTLLEGCEHD